MSALKISNSDARALWLCAHGLSAPPAGVCDTLGLIRALGFVQLDTIQIVSRAHHHILWSRNPRYREPLLDGLLARDRQVFEHFTHDASVLPMEFLPLWQRQFRRMKAKVERSSWYGGALEPELLALVKRRIADEGPLSTRDFDTKLEGPKEMWRRPPHKKALDYLWYAGELATSHRDGFIKYYDLADRVFPAELRNAQLSDQAQIDGLCRAALDRIGFGTLGEIRKFWDATDPAEVAAWAERDSGALIPVEVQGADGSWTKAWGCADLEERLTALAAPGGRLRILSPFDPAIRDRARLKRLFGFDYTVELFLPAAKRQWGYYVYPVLEGSRFVGRIEAKADRAAGVLSVLKWWDEPGVRASKARAEKLEAELARFARLAGVERVVWECPR
ncbi:winged helix-turn-helix domain-containing protein [Pararhodobacter zhoushanensis]|uniref:Winged helix DNA-binding domain-containing protein n=1 Tax=Pararhodobacter zhoushanensis TaxID=2479545 RepID=A0ABT3GZT9_9RHOB|nr:crosslink repair DNA glycosylase YcaQ family protein [Pararhodobacter zhoushanensis]MCW1933057.1 winged helix DNA-binding domain-containing protein [Pararhodobacter zhoushanensis]